MNSLFQPLSLSLAAVVLGLLFAFSNGFRDASTIVATVVSTRALSPSLAFFLCALFEILGILVLGSAVASTIGRDLFHHVMNGGRNELPLVLISSLGAAFLWGVVSWWRVWPISNSQALISGLGGASLAAWGPSHFRNVTIFTVLIVLIISPVLGFLISTGLTKLLRFSGEWMTPKIVPLLNRLHVLALLLTAGAHGSNDGQIVMGVLLLAAGVSTADFHVPLLLRLTVAAAIAGGVMLGGRRLLKKMGMTFYRIRPMQGMGAQLTAAGTMLTCALAGFPASTTQVIAGSIMGAGVAKSPRAVRWHIAQDIVLSWAITVPTVAILSYAFYLLCRVISG